MDRSNLNVNKEEKNYIKKNDRRFFYRCLTSKKRTKKSTELKKDNGNVTYERKKMKETGDKMHKKNI